jgi:hypothetical protein
MHVYMCDYMYDYIHTSTCSCIHAHAYTRMHARACIHACACMHMRTCMLVSMEARVHEPLGLHAMQTFTFDGGSTKAMVVTVHTRINAQLMHNKLYTYECTIFKA